MKKFSLTQKQARFFTMLMIMSMSVSQLFCKNRTFLDAANDVSSNLTSFTTDVITALFWPALLVSAAILIFAPKQSKPVFGAIIVGLIIVRILAGSQSVTENSVDEVSNWVNGTGNSSTSSSSSSSSSDTTFSWLFK